MTYPTDTMKVLELFAGTGVISDEFRKRGHEAYTVDWDKGLSLSLCADISKLEVDDLIKLCGGVPDVVWLSPPCQSYSCASMGHHRYKGEDGELKPKTDFAKKSDELLKHSLHLLKELQKINPELIYFIENPRAGMRTMKCMEGLPRYTITYCAYTPEIPVEIRPAKPTDIWTNHPNPKFKPACKNGAPCHARAPRGSRNGIQGIKGAKQRAIIPKGLCKHIVDICEEL